MLNGGYILKKLTIKMNLDGEAIETNFTPSDFNDVFNSNKLAIFNVELTIPTGFAPNFTYTTTRSITVATVVDPLEINDVNYGTVIMLPAIGINIALIDNTIVFLNV